VRRRPSPCFDRFGTNGYAARALTRTAAREWARHNILANVICPAAVTAPYEAFRAFDPPTPPPC
jgi:NAD(P)-dependent dehydrogenase (short-subunit alcohol dehydrogenase family)